MRIWLDDIRPAPEGWHWVKNAREFWGVFAEHFKSIEAISFDNDLGEFEIEGWHIVRDLLNCYLDCKVTHSIELTCHSANVAARKTIEGYISDIRKLTC